jgi:hypothetical protein
MLVRNQRTVPLGMLERAMRFKVISDIAKFNDEDKLGKVVAFTSTP